MKACADVLVIPSLHDNFAYVVIDEKTKKAACVDPVEPEKRYTIHVNFSIIAYQILRKIENMNVDLEYVLCTHHHYDHSGGNIRMKELKKKIKVVGSAYETTPGVSEKVYDSQIIRLGTTNKLRRKRAHKMYAHERPSRQKSKWLKVTMGGNHDGLESTRMCNEIDSHYKENFRNFPIFQGSCL
ncbi:cytosolic glyoxalase II, putative [Plasmodium ovale curtisi]|uniref:Cytosolic glyoxalase II, putative n=1 Tax=Plasmodium ovale curtisi TaxID=864141 RepID=A0A1A8VJ14_PLAOA|nr:cytosolic glyoxalase II, putative [Plasmodium ovale curtisi]SBT00744.1 cytosolic glyoxalase II, putative [Plasmodium ovale curtisi]